VVALLVVALQPLSARADEVISAEAAPSSEFRASEHGFAIALNFESAAFGYAATTQASGEAWGSRSFLDRRLLLQWEGGLGPAAGVLANSLTPDPIAGGRGAASGELGFRVLHARDWSPYVALGGAAGLQAMALTDVPLRGYDRVNNVAGEAGVNGDAAGRLTLGASWLQPTRSLVAGVFLQESFQTPPTLPSGALYNEVGLAGSLTLTRGWLFTAEGLYGSDRQETDQHFRSVNRAIYLEATASLRMRVKSRFWLEVQAKVSDDQRTASFPNTKLVYQTAEPVDASTTFAFGVEGP